MAKRKGRFTLAPIVDAAPEGSEEQTGRNRGPMASAIAENADSLQQLQDERARALEALKTDAVAWRDAQSENLIDQLVPVDEIGTAAIMRDRGDLEASMRDEAMTELKESIRTRGQQQSIRVFRDADGGLQLEQGWRRLIAFRLLHQETGGETFARIRARVIESLDDLEAAYGRMVDENLVRKDVSLGELAGLALRYAADDRTSCDTLEAAVKTLYASAHPSKRTHIRRIAELLEEMGPAMGDPSGITRAVGLEAAQMVAASPALRSDLRSRLTAGGRDPASVQEVLSGFVKDHAEAEVALQPVRKAGRPRLKEGRKLELQIGDLKCTVKGRELRILSSLNLDDADEARVRRAVAAFWNAYRAEAEE